MARKFQYPPSVKPGIPKLDECPKGWKTFKLRDLLSLKKRRISLKDKQSYQLVTAKRSRGGIVEREVRKGEEIKTPTQYRIHADDFLISRRQIVHGACGIVPQDLHNAIVSNEYNTLTVKPELLLDYLEALSHMTYFQQTCFQASVGVDIEKMVFDIDQWLRFHVNIPPPPRAA